MSARAKPQKVASAATAAAVAPAEAAAAPPPQDQPEGEDELQRSGSKTGKRATDRILQKRGEPTKKRKANARDIR